MYIIDSKKYANKTDTYATNSITYWFESMIYEVCPESIGPAYLYISES